MLQVPWACRPCESIDFCRLNIPYFTLNLHRLQKDTHFLHMNTDRHIPKNIYIVSHNSHTHDTYTWCIHIHTHIRHIYACVFILCITNACVCNFIHVQIYTHFIYFYIHTLTFRHIDTHKHRYIPHTHTSHTHKQYICIHNAYTHAIQAIHICSCIHTKTNMSTPELWSSWPIYLFTVCLSLCSH